MRLSVGLATVAMTVAMTMCLTACGAGFSGAGGDKPEGTRLVKGRLQIPDDDLFGRQVTGLQVAALHINADGGIDIFPSAVFDPSEQRAEASFVATVGGGVDSFLVLQVPSATQRGIGTLIGRYTFGGDNLVPRGEDDLDLGAITVSRGARVPADTRLESGAAPAPDAQTDTDVDGLNNDVDDDDDADGIADASDADVAGDGVDDSLQRYEVLADADSDGIADVLQ